MSSRARPRPSVDDLLARLPAAGPERRALEARARAHSRDCGCALGGVFLTAALVAVPAYVVAAGDHRVRTLAAGALALLGAAAAGKLAGLALARARLALLRRTLLRKVGGG
ncbi:MAG TPA: hypothetical protein VFB42_01825 [Gaiellaceae bacterium]|nr:hypothetical protein [Gaiellaceae bacterium]